MTDDGRSFMKIKIEEAQGLTPRGPTDHWHWTGYLTFEYNLLHYVAEKIRDPPPDFTTYPIIIQLSHQFVVKQLVKCF